MREEIPVKKKIILASASPRRRELLAQIGVEFEIKVSQKEETYQGSDAQEVVKNLACMKAEAVEEEILAEEGTQAELRDTVILGSDTVVVLDGEILGKPKDIEDARRMLEQIRGRAHKVCTGTALISYDSEGRRTLRKNAVTTKVNVHDMTEDEISAYIATGEPMDKAGAYGIQGRFAAYIDGIEGDYYNVVGLPVSSVYQTLKELEAF